MSVRMLKALVWVACAAAICAAPAPAVAQDHTVTYYCVDLNDLWNVKVPVIAPAALIDPPVAPPVDPGCRTSFPIAVPRGSSIAPGNLFWFTNKTYPPAVRAALEAMDYNFHSQSPAEDFMSKLAEIRVEIWDFPYTTNLATFRFNPRHNFRLRRWGEYMGQLGTEPIADPELGIDLSAEEVARLPMLGFPVIAGPIDLPPGVYVMRVYLTMSDWHNDGTCLDPGCNLSGEIWYRAMRFVVQ